MPTVGSTRKRLSDVVKGVNAFENEAFVDFCYATVDVKAASDTDIDNIGIPLVYSSSDSAFVVYDAQDISAVTGSPLPAALPICVTVGTAAGAGVNTEDTTIGTTATEMTVLFRGPAAVCKDGFEWGSTTETNQNEFYAQFEVQNVTAIESGTTVDPTFAG